MDTVRPLETGHGGGVEEEGGDGVAGGAEVPQPHRPVRRPRHQPCPRHLQAPDAPRVPLQRAHCLAPLRPPLKAPLGARPEVPEVPHLEAVVVAAAHEDVALDLQAADALHVAGQRLHQLPRPQVPLAKAFVCTEHPVSHHHTTNKRHRDMHK